MKMDLDYFIEEPLLRAVFFIFFAGILIRITFLIYSIIRDIHRSTDGYRKRIRNIWPVFLPFGIALVKRPFYVLSRHVFHLCLFIVPIWLSGHIVLWEESRFELSWQPLPDVWADGLTIAVLVFIACFLIRRIFLPRIRANSSVSDYLLILITALPFLTGYFLTHGTLDVMPNLGDKMLTFHILSAEAMLLTTVLLFFKVQPNESICTGCAACILSCPVGALETYDAGYERILTHAHYQCICCGTCVQTCPETAAELQHEIKIGKISNLFSKKQIRVARLAACKNCGAPFIPEAQLYKAEKILTDNYIHLCPACKRSTISEQFYQMDSRRKNFMAIH